MFHAFPSDRRLSRIPIRCESPSRLSGAIKAYSHITRCGRDELYEHIKFTALAFNDIGIK